MIQRIVHKTQKVPSEIQKDEVGKHKCLPQGKMKKNYNQGNLQAIQ
jgi:hypothetical protein